MKKSALTVAAAGFSLLGVLAGAPLAQDNQSEERIANRVAEFSGLDKITGRIITFDVYIDETVQFGALQVTPRVCYSRPSTLTPKTDAFIEVDEITLDRKIRRIFTGWMFADSPGLNAIEHPVYDIWLKDCKMESEEVPPPAAPSRMPSPRTTAATVGSSTPRLPAGRHRGGSLPETTASGPSPASSGSCR